MSKRTRRDRRDRRDRCDKSDSDDEYLNSLNKNIMNKNKNNNIYLETVNKIENNLRYPVQHYSKDVQDWLDKIDNKIDQRTIKYSDIIKLNLPEEEQIWFVEHIRMLENLDEQTEEHYILKNTIYSKYRDLEKNADKNKKNKIILDKLKEISHTNVDISTRIAESDFPDNIKAEIYKKYNFVNSNSNAEKNDEYYKIVEWIDTVLTLPTKLKITPVTNISDQMFALKKSLDDKIFGLDNVKEKIIETYCAMLTNPHYKKKFMAFVGPPGCGKTELGKAIASAFDLPFGQISFGGIKDPATLTGHSLAYIGSRAGLFSNILRQTKFLNSVVLLDEIDKIPQTFEGYSISSILLHVLDKTQNETFQDMYMPEIPINLSHIFFVLALNDIETVDPILLDRLCIIQIDGYDLSDKIHIAQEYMLPKLLSNLSFQPNEIIIDNNIMKYLIEKYDTDKISGVRDLENIMTTLCERLNVLKNVKNRNNKKIKLSYMIDNISFPITLNKNIVDTLAKDT